MTVDELKEMKEGEVPAHLLRIKLLIHERESVEMDIDDLYKEVEVYYIQGPSGVGKTCKAKELLKEHGYKKVKMIKYENGFWNNVGDGTGCCLYDEWRDSDMRAREFINFIDYNVQIMNVKGGCIKNQFKLIVITSVQPLNEIYLGLRYGTENEK